MSGKLFNIKSLIRLVRGGVDTVNDMEYINLVAVLALLGKSYLRIGDQFYLGQIPHQYLREDEFERWRRDCWRLPQEGTEEEPEEPEIELPDIKVKIDIDLPSILDDLLLIWGVDKLFDILFRWIEQREREKRVEKILLQQEQLKDFFKAVVAALQALNSDIKRVRAGVQSLRYSYFELKKAVDTNVDTINNILGTIENLEGVDTVLKQAIKSLIKSSAALSEEVFGSQADSIIDAVSNFFKLIF